MEVPTQYSGSRTVLSTSGTNVGVCQQEMALNTLISLFFGLSATCLLTDGELCRGWIAADKMHTSLCVCVCLRAEACLCLIVTSCDQTNTARGPGAPPLLP